MLVYPVLVVALGALWPLDWTPTRLDSLSPVTGHYHGSTWAMAEMVTQGDDPGEEVVVVEGTTSDEAAKNKESPKGWKGKFRAWAQDWDLVDKNGKFRWGLHVGLFGMMVLFGVMVVVGGLCWGGLTLVKNGSEGSAWVPALGIVAALVIFIGLGIAMWYKNK
uniref:Membrane protein n=1 Tax=Babesia bovis TaxID=5865 RepID=S6BE74_BABBO|nr:membrane protein [Babesia bovis]BAN65506.1 membrane protein [Babesia bovis]